MIFINGIYSTEFSNIRSQELTVQSLEEAAGNEFSDIVSKHLGNSSRYSKDGIHALNSAFAHQGVFIHVAAGKVVSVIPYTFIILPMRAMLTFSHNREIWFM